MYLIPKNIKIKREIFKGFGIFECIAIAVAVGIGYFLTLFFKRLKIKMMLFCIPPILTFLLLLPIPNVSTVLKILFKFIKYKINQKKYKLK